MDFVYKQIFIKTIELAKFSDMTMAHYGRAGLAGGGKTDLTFGLAG